MASAGKYRGRIVRPIPYEDGSGSRLVAPVGAYDIAEVGGAMLRPIQREPAEEVATSLMYGPNVPA
jgi:hypothetical protein